MYLPLIIKEFFATALGTVIATICGRKARQAGWPCFFDGGLTLLTAVVAPETKSVSGWRCTTAEACAKNREGARTAGAMPQGGSFGEFMGTLVDVVNPLQHIPVVSSVYRRVTGDTISGPAMIAGGALYGGPIGGALAAADVAIAQQSGDYAGDAMLASMMGDAPAATSQPVMLAAANTAPDDATVTLSAAAGDSFFVSSKSASYQTPSHSTLLSASPTPNRTRTASDETAMPRAPDTPVTQQHGAEYVPATFRHSGNLVDVQRLTAMETASGSPSLPDAPADPRTGIPPELMAAKMMEALDKYAAMKSGGL